MNLILVINTIFKFGVNKKYFIFFLYTVYGFVKNPLNNKFINNLYVEPLALYNNNNNFNKDIYTIISKSNNFTDELLDLLTINNIDYIYIDITELNKEEIKMIYIYYNISKTKININNDILIFKNFDEYIGGIFEMYKIIIFI
jgi:hypothetical protein